MEMNNYLEIFVNHMELLRKIKQDAGKGHFSLLVMLLGMSIILSGCFFRGQVRHLTSDVCLINENLRKEEVLQLMGPPELRNLTPEGTELWVYYDARKSFLRKLPLVGPGLGYVRYDVVTVNFVEEIVQRCNYRFFSEEEFSEHIKGSGGIVEHE